MNENLDFDYIVVGAGSAGCVLANRLSEDNSASVCLIEAGPPDRSWQIHVPLALFLAMINGKINWKFNTTKQSNAANRSIFVPRGKTLGGSSSINGMVYIRGNSLDYDEWADQGNHDWSWENVKPYFLKSEKNEQFGGDEYHGKDGNLNVTFISDPNPLVNSFIEAAEGLQYQHNPDFNGQNQEGFGRHQVTQKGGRRWSSARAFLEPAKLRKNLKIFTGKTVKGVLFEQGKAVGVSLAKDTRIIKARREVILSAGAIISPQLLMQSGIGDGEELKGYGIDIQQHLPGVGKNLQDHVSINCLVRTKSLAPVGFSIASIPKLTYSVFDYLIRKRGLWSSNMIEAGGFVRTKPNLKRPNIQYVFMPVIRRPPKLITYGHGFVVTTVLLHPKSRGRLTLSANDEDFLPKIDPAFFDQSDDLEVLLRGLKEAQRICQSSKFEKYKPFLWEPSFESTDEDLRNYIMNNSATIFHPVGTCKMGNDKLAVVDQRLRVHGVKGLRVIDASIMPTITSGNTNAPTIMIGEKGADLIKQDWR